MKALCAWLLLPWLAGGCVSRLPIDRRPCPCTAEEVCCATLDVCLTRSQSCPPIADGSSAAPGEGGVLCSEDPPAPSDVIDDMEHGTAVPSGYPAGIWFLANDGTGGSQEPPVGQPPLPAEIPNGRCASRHALHMSGVGFQGWGAEAGLVLRVDEVPGVGGVSQPIDASEYAGVRFFARVAAGTNTQLLVAVGDVNTVPEGDVCGTSTEGLDRRCYNLYAAGREIGSEWAEYRVPFSELKQLPDWGNRTSELAQSKLYGINFEFQVSSDPFDLWLDDVAWLRP